MIMSDRAILRRMRNWLPNKHGDNPSRRRDTSSQTDPCAQRR